jgi:hypothetical protein
MLRIVSRLSIALALSGAIGFAFVANAEDLHGPAKAGAHDGKHVGGKSDSGKGLASKGPGSKGLTGSLGRVDGAIAVGILGLGIINAITNSNAPPPQ